MGCGDYLRNKNRLQTSPVRGAKVIKFLSFLFALSAFAGNDPSNQFKLGDGTQTDKKIIFNQATTNQPQIKYDAGLSKLRFSHDGITFSDMGSGGTIPITYVGSIYADLFTGSTVLNVSSTSEVDFTLSSGSSPTHTSNTFAAGFTIASPTNPDHPGMSLTGPAGRYMFVADGLFRLQYAGNGRGRFIFCDSSTCSDDHNALETVNITSSCMLFGNMLYASPLSATQIRIKGAVDLGGRNLYLDSALPGGGITIHVLYTP